MMHLLPDSLIEILKRISLIGAATFFISLAFSHCIKKLQKISRLQENLWFSSLLNTIAKPFQTLIALTGLFFFGENLLDYFTMPQLASLIAILRNLATIGFVTYILLKWKTDLEAIWKKEKHVEEKSSIEKATFDAVGRLISFSIILISALTSLQVLGMPIQSFLALGAVGAAGLAWASTDIIKNFFGGFMIHVMRPFAVGDWINSPEKDIEGIVEQIGWYQTQIRTFDKRPIYVPNGLFPAIVLRNPSRMSNRRILADIGIRFDDIAKVEPIVNDIERMLKTHPAIDKSKILMVHFVSFGPYALTINVYCFTKTTDWAEWRKKQQEVFLKIAEIIEEHGAKMAFPTQTLQIEKEATFFSEQPQPAFPLN